ncbi:MAG: type II toxin-antitoxin system YoeB family toxin [Capnocytophaga sp.]|nr:type II toxin-antitoxin system YoeB family toxin [Capnocytophaga sp.]
MEKHPTTGTRHVERLKRYNERSIWSRKIDKKYRLIYEVFV